MALPFSNVAQESESVFLPNGAPLCRVRKGTSALIFSGPHNGTYVPPEYYEGQYCLGLPKAYFDPENRYHSHETCDPGVAGLWALMAERFPEASTFATECSRLLADINRRREHAITVFSPEYPQIPIPGNQNLSPEDIEARLQTFYDPCNAALNKLIDSVKNAYGGVIYIELHSFSPIWRGKERLKEIGTIYFEDNPLAEALNGQLRDVNGLAFEPHFPYNRQRRYFF